MGFEAAACVDLSALDGLNLDFPPLNSNNSNNYRLISIRVTKKKYLSFILLPVLGLFSLISEVIKLLYYPTRAIISRGLYIFNPISRDHFFVFKEVFSENSVLI